MPKKILNSPFSILNYILALILYSHPSPAHSQFSILHSPFSILNSYAHRYFGIREGLPKSEVMALFQDENGYLWASGEGVSRFDGRHFVNYSMKDLQCNTYVMKFYQYESAVVLVSLSNIVYIYPDQTIEHYPFPDHYRMNHNVTKITENCIYLFNCRHESKRGATPYSLFRFDLKSKTYTNIAEDLPFLSSFTVNEKIYAANTISDGKISAATDHRIRDKQLMLYRLDDDVLKKIYAVKMQKDLFAIDFLEKTKRNEWFGTITTENFGVKRHQFCQFFIENDTIRWKYLLPVAAPVNSMAQWDEHRLLLGFKENVPSQIMDLETCKLSPFPIDIKVSNNVLIDKDRNFWFATETGLIQCPRFFFESYQPKMEARDIIYGVLKDSQQNIWFSGFNGILRADRQGKLHKVMLTSNQENISRWVRNYSNRTLVVLLL